MATLHRELTTDFADGMYDSAAPTAVPRKAVTSLINGRIQPDGSIRRRPGTIRMHSSAVNTGTGFGAAQFTTANGTDTIVAIVDTSAYKSTDGGATWSSAIGTSLRADYYNFATIRIGADVWLCMANGDSTIKKYNGSTWTTVSNAPSGAKFIATFNGRLWATGHSGVDILASKIADEDIWATPNGLSLKLNTHSGENPTGLFQIGPHLLVFDRHATSYIDGFGEQTIIIAKGATGWSRSVGCVAFRTITAIGDNGVAWLSERGIEYYTPGEGIRLISRQVDTFLQSIDWDLTYQNPGRPTACYDATEQNLHVGLSTIGSRNNRTLVLNLRTNVGWQRTGQLAAASIDRQESASGDLFFSGDSDGYWQADADGFALDADAEGYASLATAGGGDVIGEDSDGYLTSLVSDALPSTLFIATTSLRPTTVHSLGYDGFVRKHLDVGRDDVLSDQTSGEDVQMTIVTRPFLHKRPDMEKNVRTIHIASIQDGTVTVTALIRGKGDVGGERSITMPATALGQAKRKRAMTKWRADTPQLEVRTTDDVRVTMLGLSSELLREPV